MGASSAVAFAQAPNELQQRSQDQERRAQEQRLEQERLRSTPYVRLKPASGETAQRLAADESPCFPILSPQLSGDKNHEFGWLLEQADGRGQLDEPDPIGGKCLGAAGVQQVVDRLQNALIARGYVTSRVLAPAQNLQDGTLSLQIIPGLIQSIDWGDGGSQRASRWNTVPASPGDLLNLRDVEQALENFKRVPTAEADIQIAPGTEPGTSSLRIVHQQPMPFRVAASADDSGTRSTGKYQGSLTFSYDNWWTLSDLFYVTLLHDLGGRASGERGTQGHIVHYSLPYGYWLLGATHSANRYRQSVAGASQSYLYSGTSSNTEIKLSRVLHRDASSKTSASLKGFERTSNNYIDDAEVEVQRRVVGGLEWGLNHKRNWPGGILDVNANYRRGTGAWGSLPAPEEPFGEGTSRMKLWLLDAALQQAFTLGGRQMNYSVAWRTQQNRTPLTPQDRFAVGGRYTVRGFDGLSVLSAERGWLLRNDISTAIAQGHQAYVGEDAGHVAGPSAANLVGNSLTGGVVGVRGQWARFQYDIFVGRPLSKPDHFNTSKATAGFSLSVSL